MDATFVCDAFEFGRLLLEMFANSFCSWKV